MSTPQTTIQVPDEISDTLGRLAEMLDDVKATLDRIARAVEALAATGSG